MNPVLDPRGMCISCRHSVWDPAEIAQEIAHITAKKGSAEALVVNTMDRQRNAEGVEVGDKLERAVVAYEDMTTVLWERFRVRPQDVGLCELGVASFVTRSAGQGLSDKGQRNDQCPRWSAAEGQLHQVRLPGWRDKMRLLQALRSGRTKKVGPNAPCPCGSGRKFKGCCARWI